MLWIFPGRDQCWQEGPPRKDSILRSYSQNSLDNEGFIFWLLVRLVISAHSGVFVFFWIDFSHFQLNSTPGVPFSAAILFQYWYLNTLFGPYILL